MAILNGEKAEVIAAGQKGCALGPIETRRVPPPAALLRWRCAATAAAIILLAIMAGGGQAQSSEPGEYELKAAFLFNFAKFVDWPADSFRSPQSPFQICILGKDPFGRAIDDVLRGKTLGSHPVSVARVKDTGEARRCQIVFVSAAESGNARAIVEGLRGSKALVVGESEGFAEAGGMIQFTVEENHVRFLINPEAGEREGLKFSSKLLSLATIVHNTAASGRS